MILAKSTQAAPFFVFEEIEIKLHKHGSRKEVKISINSELLDKCDALNVDLSATLEHALEQELLVMERAASWQKENAEAIAAYNEFVEKHGLFGDAFRKF
ncbi:MAG: type II toxin-antitoxin system CcdA family antitoxin [Gammaproteobacteria bacterium]